MRSLIGALIISAGVFSTAQALPKYWVGTDPNPAPNGTWDTGTTPTWNDAADGTGLATVWNDFDIAHFSAGTGATGAFNVTVNGTVTPDGILFEEGDVTVSGGTMDFFGTMNVAGGASGTINSTITATGTTPLTKTGDGTLTLGGDNSTFDGNIFIDAGTLKVTHSGVFGIAGTVDQASEAAIADGVSVRNGATLEIADGVTVTDRVFVSGTGVGGAGAIRKTGSGNSTIQGGIRFFTAGSVIADAGTLTLTQNFVSRSPGITELTFGGAGNIVTTASPNLNLSVSSTRLVKVGSGTMTLGGISANTNGWTVNGGTLSYTSDGTTPDTVSYNLGRYPAAFDPDHIILNGGTLRTTQPTSAVSFISSNRGIQIGANGGTLSYVPSTPGTQVSLYPGTIGKVAGADPAVLTINTTNEIRMSAATQVHTFDKLVLQSGIYGIGQGTNLAQDTQLGAVPANPLADAITFNGGTLRVLGGLSGSTPVAIHANRGVTINAPGGTINTSNMNANFLGAFTGPGALTKSGGLGLILSGDSNYSGGTTVTAGTFQVNNTTGSGTGSGAVTVSGGTLGGEGTIAGGVAMNGTSHASPGSPAAPFSAADAGILTVGGVTFASGSFLDIQLGGTTLGTQFDRLAVTGAAALNGTLNVTLFNSFVPVLNDTFHVLTAGGGLGDTTFTTVNLPTLADPNIQWDVNYEPNFLELKIVSADVGVPGDFNGDGDVDARDYVIWRKTNVDGPAGYTAFYQNFGNYPPPGSGGGDGGNAAVPEPAAFALVMIGLAGFAACRRDR